MQSPFVGEREEEIPGLQSKFDVTLWEGLSPFEEIGEEQHFLDVLPDFGKMYGNWKDKIGKWTEDLGYWTEKANKNVAYGNSLGWSKYNDRISDLLLKTTGKSNKDHSSAHFASLVAQWQAKNGFSGKDVDGILGPNTWKKMHPMLGITPGTASHWSSIKDTTVARVQQYSSLIERLSKELAFNPNIVRGIIAAESGGNRYSGKGGKGYKGLMQAKRDEAQFDPETSIRTGIRLFIEMRDRNLGPRLSKLGIDRSQIDDETFLKLVLCSYNAGHVSVLKALSYAIEDSNWRNWFEGSHYKRGLLFTGAYSKYAKCGTEGLEEAKKDAALYRFKGGIHWLKQPDPPKWGDAILKISPLLRCWIETKYSNTPGYLNKILGYFRYFEGHGTSQELENKANDFRMDITDSFYTESFVEDIDEAIIDVAEHDSRRQDGDFEQPDETAFYEDRLLPTSRAYFLPEANAKKTSMNTLQVQKSGIGHSAIIAALASHLDYKGIATQLQLKNATTSGHRYFIDPSFSRVDSVFTEAIHQFQIDHFIDTKEHDGILGRTTLETFGIYSHGLKPKLNSSRFYNQGILNKNDIKSKIPALTNSEFTAGNWYGEIIKPGFLGIKITDGIHVLLFRKLKAAETWLKSQAAYQGLSPAKLGIALGFTSGTRYSGARLTAAKQAMHGFGLALDIHVAGNPWIGAGWIKNDPKLLQERFRMLTALKKASGLNLPGKTVFEYLDYIAQSEGTDTRKAYATLRNRNDEFIKLIQNNPNELSYWKQSQTFGRRDPLDGFLNMHPDLVYALRQIAGLAWGAIDFGPRASGDIMHFDLRMEGIGKFLCEKIGGYVPKSSHPLVNNEMLSDEIDFLENSDVSEFDEAEGEEDWADEEYDAQGVEKFTIDDFIDTKYFEEGYVDDNSFKVLDEAEDYESFENDMYLEESETSGMEEEIDEEEFVNWELDNEENVGYDSVEENEGMSNDFESFHEAHENDASDLYNEDAALFESGEDDEEEAFYEDGDKILEETGSEDCGCKKKNRAEESTSYEETEINSSLRNNHHFLGEGKSILISESEMWDEQEVFNPDTRKQITHISNINNAPFRWICSLTFYFRDPDDFGKVIEFEGGSGLLISSCHVLTSAHQIYAEITGSKGSKQKQRALRAKVYPGRDGSSFPFGKADSSNFAYPGAFIAGFDARYDYGLIKLKQKIGLQKFKRLNNEPLGYWGSKNWGRNTHIKALSTSYLKSQVVNVAGYPKGKNNKQYLAFDSVRDTPPTANGIAVNELITYLVDTSEGQSGSPVWKYIRNSGNRYLIAIHRGGCHANLDGCIKSGKVSANMGVLITQSVINQIRSWIKTM